MSCLKSFSPDPRPVERWKSTDFGQRFEHLNDTLWENHFHIHKQRPLNDRIAGSLIFYNHFHGHFSASKIWPCYPTAPTTALLSDSFRQLPTAPRQLVQFMCSRLSGQHYRQRGLKKFSRANCVREKFSPRSSGRICSRNECTWQATTD